MFQRRRIVDELREQLTFQPIVATRNRKRLELAVPDFEHAPPIWELRIAGYRVFYDVDEPHEVVFVRAVRQKEPRQMTGDIIREGSDS